MSENSDNQKTTEPTPKPGVTLRPKKKEGATPKPGVTLRPKKT